MADAIVSALLQQLITIIDKEIREEVKLVTGVDKEVKKLTNNLLAIKAVLVDAECRHGKEEIVRLWLDQLRDVAYDMEDVLDEWNTARLKLQIEGIDENVVDVPHTKKKVCFLSTATCFGFKQVVRHRDIAYKIKEINEKMDHIAREKDMFSFNVLNVTKSIDERPERVPTVSLVDESEIFGRAMERNALVSKLVSESSAQQKGLHIISLVGMGGIGKTTLAQLAYNNEEVKRNFEKIIWVCVSDSFEELKIAKAIIEALEGSSPNLNELQSLIGRIQNSIRGKKFLLVLDDVWNEDYNKWEPFYYCLKNGLHGSRLLITTRKKTVAHMMASTDIISIKELGEEECWLIFKQLAFFGRSNEECKKLEQVGQNIASKCKGLPLAAKTMGGLLCSKRTKEEWQRILDSELWKLEELENRLSSAFFLSYNDLPSTIKRCFSYCAIFPKGYIIWKDELVKLWMAQGYLNAEQDEEMEIIGQEYFDILVTRSFFQNFVKDEDDSIIKCKMHDLVHDFAQSLSNSESSVVEVNGHEESIVNSYNNKVCHLMLNFHSGASFPVSIYKVKSLRSLLFHRKSVQLSLFGDFVPELFGELTCLRALDIRRYHARINMIKEIPSEVGKMIHLRYINLSGENIAYLPESLCELYNLQTLDITHCQYLKELPQGMGKLINMKYLLNDGTRSLQYMPAGIVRLTNLRTLKKIVLDDNQRCTPETLKNLNLLRECSIYGLGNMSSAVEAKTAGLVRKRNLLILSLRFDAKCVEERRKNEEDEKVLETLQPPPRLKVLQIYFFRGSNLFPRWMMSLTNLRDLRLFNCLYCEHLPSLGKLPSLEKLHIHGLHCVNRVGNEFLGIENDGGSSSSSSVTAFSALKSLMINYMLQLEEWNYKITGEAKIMPRLSYLQIYACPNLKALPDHIFQLTTLQTLDIRGNFILEKHYRKRSGEDWPKTCHIPNFHVGSDSNEEEEADSLTSETEE